MFSNIKMDSAELKIVIGPMFSGKTTSIIKQWKINKLKNIKTLVVNYSEDNRYSQTNLSSHDRVEIPCIKLSKMLEVYSFIGESKERIQCILINEGHAYEYDGGKKKKFVAEIQTEKAAKKEDLVDKPSEE